MTIKSLTTRSDSGTAAIRVLAGSKLNAEQTLKVLAENPAIKRLDATNGLVVIVATVKDVGPVQ